MSFWEAFALAAPGWVLAVVVVILSSWRNRADQALGKLIEYRHARIVEAHAALTSHWFVVIECVRLLGPPDGEGRATRVLLRQVSDELHVAQMRLTHTFAMVAPYMDGTAPWSKGGKAAYVLGGFVELSRMVIQRVVDEVFVEWQKGEQFTTYEFAQKANAHLQTLQNAFPDLREWFVAELNPGAIKRLTLDRLSLPWWSRAWAAVSRRGSKQPTTTPQTPEVTSQQSATAPAANVTPKTETDAEKDVHETDTPADSQS